MLGKDLKKAYSKGCRGQYGGYYMNVELKFTWLGI